MSFTDGSGAGRRAVTIHKIINVAPPVEEVFAFWSDYQNFPRFMSNVRDVKLTVAGPEQRLNGTR